MAYQGEMLKDLQFWQGPVVRCWDIPIEAVLRLLIAAILDEAASETSEPGEDVCDTFGRGLVW